MRTLNLTATGENQARIKDYLEKNSSEVLADKINNGVYIEKDGKRLLNKKDLNGFMNFALNEAKKLVDNGAIGTYVDDAVVFGWAIHYFEEENIEGKLYNEDGTEYKEPKKTVTVKPKTTKSTVKTSPTTIEPTMDLFSRAEKGVSEICVSLENKNQGVQAETSVPLSSSEKKKLPKGVSEAQMSLFDF